MGPCFSTSKHSHQFFFLYIQSEIHLLQLVSTGSCPFVVHLWEQFGSLFSTISLSKVHSLIIWALWRSKNFPVSSVCVCSALPSRCISSCSHFLPSFSLYLCLRWPIPHTLVWPGWTSPSRRRWEGKIHEADQNKTSTWGVQVRDIVLMAPLKAPECSVGTDWLLTIFQAWRKAAFSPFYCLSFVPLHMHIFCQKQHM